MSDFQSTDFQDKVVVITGAGRGLGRSHALEFAKRGAKVLVNDLGGRIDGTGVSNTAHAVVEEIQSLGGTALANTASVAEEMGAQSIIDDALSPLWFGGYSGEQCRYPAGQDLLQDNCGKFLKPCWMCTSWVPSMSPGLPGR